MSTYREESQDRVRYAEALRERWWLILAVVAVAVATAATYSLTAEKRYEAGVDVLVTPLDDDALPGTNVLRVGGDPNRSVLTVARLAKTREVADGVRRRYAPTPTSGDVLGSIEVEPVGQANIVRIVASSTTAKGAARLANWYAQVLINQRSKQFQSDLREAITRLRRRMAAIPPDVRMRSGEAIAIQERLAEFTSLQGAKDPSLSIASRAVPPASAAWPRPVLSITIAFLAAVLLGTGLAIAVEMVNQRLRSEDELLFNHRLPVLARVPHMQRRKVRNYLAGRRPLPADAWEAYRTLRANLLTGTPDGGVPETILVTSAMAGEGKTMTSVNLAITLAAGGLNVVLVDADLRRPMVATVFSLPSPNEGFANLVAQDAADAARAPQLVSVNGFGERLRLVLSNPVDVERIHFLEPRRLRERLRQLKRDADVVIVDSSAATEVADALTFAKAVDAVLIAVRVGYTRRDRLNELRRMLAQHDIAPLGFVVTSRGRAPRYGHYRATAPEISHERPTAPRRSLRRVRT